MECSNGMMCSTGFGNQYIGEPVQRRCVWKPIHGGMAEVVCLETKTLEAKAEAACLETKT